MKIVTVVVGWNYWHKYTLPAILSIQRYEPRGMLQVIDNGSDFPYPPVSGVWTAWSNKRRGYAAGINAGITLTEWADMHLILNNDVLCHGPYLRILRSLDPSKLWCANTRHLGEHKYVDGWMYIISKEVREKVGLFDEGYDGSFSDVDYSLAVQRAGVEIEVANMPFSHLEVETRKKAPGYKDRYREGYRRLEEKWGISLELWQ